jgi:NAD(P)-binding Rossmann-like domain
MKRRTCIQLMGAGAALYFVRLLVGEAAVSSNVIIPYQDFDAIGPVNRSIGDAAPREFSGDFEPAKAHEVLWDVDKYIEKIGGLPAPSEKTDVVVIGGGISGLLATYFLRNHKPILLERAPRFGGNSQAESWRGVDYPLGASYISPPEKGSAIDRFLKEIKVADKVRIYKNDDPIFIDGKRYDDYWKNGTTPGNKHQFVKIKQFLADVCNEKNGQIYPDIPADEKKRKAFDALDSMTMKECLTKVLGEPLHPHVEHFIEYYFWSSAAGSASELSAASGLNFLAADAILGVAITPGGNGAIAEHTLKALTGKVPRSHLRPSSFVFDVRVVSNGVNVSYVDHSDKVATLQARLAVMCCPKFVAAKILRDIEPERAEAIKKLKYRSYLVANVMVEQYLKDFFYDIYFMKDAAMKESNSEKKALSQMATDVTYASIPHPNPSRVVLTAYRPMPFEGAREQIYSSTAYAKYRAEFEKQIFSDFLPKLGVEKTNVVDLRITCWGHPLPLAERGLAAGKVVDVIRKPFKDRVYFIEQDNWMTPACEVAFGEARHWTQVIHRQLTAGT